MDKTYPVGPIVYYAQISDCTEYVKIGRTVNLNNRIKGFLRDLAKFKLPDEVKILDWHKCDSELEAVKFETYLQVIFEGYRAINRPYPNAAEFFDAELLSFDELPDHFQHWKEIVNDELYDGDLIETVLSRGIDLGVDMDRYCAARAKEQQGVANNG